jgi:GH24 family phage-related lysozyme (muramidase)
VSNFVRAARATSRPAPLPHQQAAWNWAWELLAPDEQQEFLSKFRADPVPKPTLAWEPAAKLIREFEGFSDVAYICPAGVPTIGWGTTRWSDGAAVKIGDTITRDAADGLLDNMLETQVVPALAKTIPGWKTLSAQRQNALISFAYNVGWHFCGSPDFVTISKCLRESDYDAVPAALMLYVNAGTPAEHGLRRRREAEAKLWGIPTKASSVLLKVPYEYQLDNKSGTGYRECFSSSCAMIARYHGKVKSDDEYNAIRAKFGDTTDAQAQVLALRALGLTNSRFVTNCAPGLLEAEIRAGRPVAVGWLHQGPYNAPTGGGHWSVIIGFDPDYWILNDPNGEADLINGGYVNHTKGAGVKYSKPRFNRRWEVDGASTAWALLVKP